MTTVDTINSFRLSVLTYLLQKATNHPGKTAVMKYMFFLQHCFQMPLKYRFGIYTYGPFSQEVMADIDMAASDDIVKIIYCNNGYSISYNEESNFQKETLHSEHQRKISKMLECFGQKNARELELFSTTAFVHIAHQQNNLNLDGVVSEVHSLKPHFTKKKIDIAYEDLKKMNILPH